MKLVQFINQLQASAGDKDGEKHTPATVLQYINEEVAYVTRKFREKATISHTTTTDTYRHTVDFSGKPVIQVEAILIAGAVTQRRIWNDVRRRIANEV